MRPEGFEVMGRIQGEGEGGIMVVKVEGDRYS